MERGIKLPQSPSEWGFKGENYLFVIAIDKYAEWKPLNNAVRDVNDIIKLLTSRYQFSPEKTITLLNEDATENNIRKTLLDLKRSITSEDNLVIFFSGHGEYDEDLDEGYWVPADAKKNDPKDYISNSDVLKWVKAIKTHHTLILIDSCFSGTLVQHSRGDVLSEKYPSRRIFASGRKELVDDGTPGSHSPFAGAILSRLNNNTDRTMRASELIQNVTKTVETTGGQSPVEGRLKDAGDEGGEFVFHLKVSEEEIWSSVLKTDSIEGYSKYLEYYPDGRYAIEATNKVSGFDDTNDWNQVKLYPTKNSIKNYLNKHPKGIYYKNGLELLGKLEEDEFWNQVINRDTESAYREYLYKYPNGHYFDLGQKALEKLNKLPNPEPKIPIPEPDVISKGPVRKKADDLSKSKKPIQNKSDLKKEAIPIPVKTKSKSNKSWVLFVAIFILFFTLFIMYREGKLNLSNFGRQQNTKEVRPYYDKKE